MSAPAESLLRPVSRRRSTPIRDVSLPDAGSQNGKEAGYCLVEDGGASDRCVSAAIRGSGTGRASSSTWSGPAAGKRSGGALPPARPPAPRGRERDLRTCV